MTPGESPEIRYCTAPKSMIAGAVGKHDLLIMMQLSEPQLNCHSGSRAVVRQGTRVELGSVAQQALQFNPKS